VGVALVESAEATRFNHASPRSRAPPAPHREIQAGQRHFPMVLRQGMSASSGTCTRVRVDPPSESPSTVTVPVEGLSSPAAHEQGCLAAARGPTTETNSPRR